MHPILEAELKKRENDLHNLCRPEKGIFVWVEYRDMTFPKSYCGSFKFITPSYLEGRTYEVLNCDGAPGIRLTDCVYDPMSHSMVMKKG